MTPNEERPGAGTPEALAQQKATTNMSRIPQQDCRKDCDLGLPVHPTGLCIVHYLEARHMLRYDDQGRYLVYGSDFVEVVAAVDEGTVSRETLARFAPPDRDGLVKAIGASTLSYWIDQGYVSMRRPTVAQMAHELGISRATYYRRMRPGQGTNKPWRRAWSALRGLDDTILLALVRAELRRRGLSPLDLLDSAAAAEDEANE